MQNCISASVHIPNADFFKEYTEQGPEWPIQWTVTPEFNMNSLFVSKKLSLSMKKFKLPLVKDTIIIFKMALKTFQQEILVY